jgi:hypothetical protein
MMRNCVKNDESQPDRKLKIKLKSSSACDEFMIRFIVRRLFLFYELNEITFLVHGECIKSMRFVVVFATKCFY